MRSIFFETSRLRVEPLAGSISDPFSGRGGADAMCPSCARRFWGWKARRSAVFHYLQDCHGSVADERIAERVEWVLGRLELRLNQRALLRYANAVGFFAVTSQPDSVSLHSLGRLGLVTQCGHPGAPMQERFWHITELGRLVLAAIDRRETDIGARSRPTQNPRRRRQAPRERSMFS